MTVVSANPKAKFDEFFLRWFSDPAVQEALRGDLASILQNKSLPFATGGLAVLSVPSPPLSPHSPRRRTPSPDARPMNNRGGAGSLGLSKGPNLMSEFTKAATEGIPRSSSPDSAKDGKSTLATGNNSSGGRDVSGVSGSTQRSNTSQPRLSGSTIKTDALHADDQSATATPSSSASTSRDSTKELSKSIGSKQGESQSSTQSLSLSQSQSLGRTASVGKRPPQSRLAKNVPPFYFPNGRPDTDALNGHEARLKRCRDIFRSSRTNTLEVEDFVSVTVACGLPRHLSLSLFLVVDKEGTGVAMLASFEKVYADIFQRYHDLPSRVFHLLKQPENSGLVRTDFHPLLADIVNSHPGLAFLRETPEFQERYVETVIGRIFFDVNRSWSGRISLPELSRSKFCAVLSSLDTQPDINKVLDFFSYEHFYVIYCKFWELDSDHDLLIDRDDLSRHNDSALSELVVERIFSAVVNKPSPSAPDKITYDDFVFFLLAEEDKTHPTSIEYWFRCMDIDGDGVVSMFEMEYFYREQYRRMEQLCVETLSFEDCLCQTLDMVQPRDPSKITLGDLKRCKAASIFFNTFFNLAKFLEHEQRDPFAAKRENEGWGSLTDWQRYARVEYELLAMEDDGDDSAAA